MNGTGDNIYKYVFQSLLRLKKQEKLKKYKNPIIRYNIHITKLKSGGI